MAAELLLEAQGVKKSFGGVHALDGVDWEMRAGEICGVVGPNGSGKTTFFHCLTGFHSLTEGQVLWRGRDISRLPMHQRTRLGLARTFQQAEVFGSLTVRDNLEIARRQRKGPSGSGVPSTAKELIDLLRLERVAQQRAAVLPYGYKRLLGIGMAVALNPSLLLLDEPTSGVNESEAEAIHGRLAALRDLGLALGIIDHHMEFLLPLCDRVLVLKAGQPLWEGLPSEFRRNPDVVTAYLGGTTTQA